MAGLLRDIRHAFRLFRLAPSVTAIAVASVALTIGVTAVVFTALRAVVLKPLPYIRPHELVVLSSGGRAANWVSWSDMQDVARRSRTLQSVAAYHYTVLNMMGDGASPPEALYGLSIPADLFPMLGVAPMIGRNILADENQPKRNREIILSYGLWRRRFGGDAGVIGRGVVCNGYAYRIIGVMPPGFDFPLRLATTVRTNAPYMEFWAPSDLTPAKDVDRSVSWGAVARLRPGVTQAQAQQDLDVIANALAREYPRTNRDRRIEAIPLEGQILGNSRPALLLLMAAGGLFMLIGCANVANLLLSRSLARQREMVLRLALGAARTRIVRQLMTESCVVALLGGLLGFLLTALAWKVLPALLPQNIPRLITASVDWTVFGFVLGAAVLNGLVFGIVPALRVTAADPADGLRASGVRGAAGPERNPLRFAIVIGEVAMTVILVITGVQLASGFVRLMRADLGFEPHHALAAIIVPQGPNYSTPEQRAPFFRRVLDRARQLPDVESAGVANAVPFSGENIGAFIGTPDSPIPAQTPANTAEYDSVSAGYLQTLRLRLIAGRWFTPADESNPCVVMIDENAARRFLRGRDPIGQRLCINCAAGKPQDWKQVIGVVNSIRRYSLEAPPDPEIYIAGNTLGNVDFLVLRVKGRVTDAAGPLRRMVAGIDPGVSVYLAAEMSSFIGDSIADRRFVMAVLAITAALALLLAAAGVYGVMSYATSQRTQEIGIRMALRATRGSIRGLVLREGLLMAGGGMAAGVAVALPGTVLLRGMLAGIGAADPAGVAVALAIVTVTATLACLAPARRATRVDPMVALRHE
ncbi:MAG TPA: ABC transporter permease [Bryobacteraceae bacterium]|nr:ABC transporter permease [Bryobacteraceae bacterium]